MKQLLWPLIAISIWPISARTQALPDNPEPARPAANGWNRVSELARDDEIIVARIGKPTLYCHFDGATGEHLFCDQNSPWFGERTFRVDRAEVKTVRLNQKLRNFHLIVGGAAVAGFVALAVTPRPRGDETPRFIRGLAGAAAGVIVGGIVAIPISLAIPGQLVFSHNEQGWNTHSSSEPGPGQGRPDVSSQEPSTSTQAH